MREMTQKGGGLAVGERGQIWLLRALLAAGLASLFFYFDWWLGGRWLAMPWLLLGLIPALSYAAIQLVASWCLYMVARPPAAPRATLLRLSVDVFVAACGEPYDMIERTLSAACTMRGEHCTWLLDDGADPALARMARRLGAGYLTRPDRTHAKAGNVNAALARTHGEIVVIFDADHVPAPDFLMDTLGYFSDPAVGFVQVMLTFSNDSHSWIAAAAAETSLEFYNPTALGSQAVGGATLMGSNALIRRKALESIGGYRPGLAEDLATSIALHTAGWRSAYVQKALAPGMAPPDLPAWFTQQLKWARGVFELLLTAYPRAFPRLAWGQRIAYLVRMTKYWIGPAVALHLLGTIAVLASAHTATLNAARAYLVHLAPLALCDILIRQTALRAWRTDNKHVSLGRAVLLVYATWPIYTLAWFLALLRIPLGFRHTPKKPSGELNPLWLSPQLAAIALLTIGTLWSVLRAEPPYMLGLFAMLQVALHVIPCTRWLATARMRGSERRW